MSSTSASHAPLVVSDNFVPLAQVFFKTLFGDFPALVRHPLVLDFFEVSLYTACAHLFMLQSLLFLLQRPFSTWILTCSPLINRFKHTSYVQLASLPPETMSVVATRVAARDLQQASSRPAGSSAYDKHGTDRAKSGEQDLSWYTYDRSVLEGILSREVAYDERSARVVKKGEAEGSGKSNAGRNTTPSIAEIMNFTDDLGRMHKVK